MKIWNFDADVDADAIDDADADAIVYVDHDVDIIFRRHDDTINEEGYIVRRGNSVLYCRNSLGYRVHT